jgi:hypothetical protein
MAAVGAGVAIRRSPEMSTREPLDATKQGRALEPDPSALIAAPEKVWALARAPVLLTLTRRVRPRATSWRGTSGDAVGDGGAPGLVANEVEATYWPSALIAGTSPW